MSAPNKAIASARSVLFVVSPTLETIPLGFVENATFSKRVMAENIIAVGEPYPPDNVLNFEQGMISWSRFHTRDKRLAAIVTPRIREIRCYESYDLLVMDPKDNKYLALAIGVLPESFDILLRGGAAARNNYSALCRIILLDDEISEAFTPNDSALPTAA